MIQLAKLDEVNGDHVAAEEERQGLPDTRRNVSLDQRHAPSIRFTAVQNHHRDGVKPADKDAEKGDDIDASAEC